MTKENVKTVENTDSNEVIKKEYLDVEELKALVLEDVKKEVEDIIAKAKEEAEQITVSAGKRKVSRETKKQIERSEELVDYFVPIVKGSNDDELTVTINGKTWQMQRGKKIKIPRMVKEVIEHSDEQQAYAVEFMKSVENQDFGEI